jgi:hypothetical protein
MAILFVDTNLTEFARLVDCRDVSEGQGGLEWQLSRHARGSGPAIPALGL